MSKVDIKPEVFNPVYLPYLDCMSRTQIFYGGSGSGKSVFIAQRIVFDVMQGGRNYLVCRQVAATIRGSVFTQIVKIIGDWGVSGLFKINKSDMMISCTNGYQIIFVGLDDVEKLKSITPAKGSLTDIWIEEATETDRDSIKQLYKRQRGGSDKTKKRVTMSFNPILESHWIYEEFFKPAKWMSEQTEYTTPELSILRTWYEHNKFLTADDIHDLTSETDKYYYNVYTLGLWGVLGNVIFTNWRSEDLSEMRAQFTNRRNGLDFGFSSDPAAGLATHYDKARKTIYIFAELYERGLTNNVLADDMKRMFGSDYVICDSAEPKSIAELQGYGVRAQAATKGRDSVLYGIQFIQQHTVIIDQKCINTINEFRQYKWKEDKAGNAIRQPVDRNNHAIDALRYAYEDENMSSWDDVKDLGTVEDYENPWR